MDAQNSVALYSRSSFLTHLPVLGGCWGQQGAHPEMIDPGTLGQLMAGPGLLCPSSPPCALAPISAQQRLAAPKHRLAPRGPRGQGAYLSRVGDHPTWSLTTGLIACLEAPGHHSPDSELLHMLFHRPSLPSRAVSHTPSGPGLTVCSPRRHC